MNCRETEKLVKELLSTPKYNWETILTFPTEILEERQPPRPSSKQKKIIQSQFFKFKQKLCDFEQSCSAFDLFVGKAENNLPSAFGLEQEKEILPLVNKDIELLKKIIHILEKIRESINAPF
ncbi:MAG: hypothetical protein AABY36_10650 [Campylobacterota bacterium]